MRIGCPLRQLDIIDHLAIRSHTQVKSQIVSQKVRVILKELRDQLLHITWIGQCTIPFLLDTLE